MSTYFKSISFKLATPPHLLHILPGRLSSLLHKPPSPYSWIIRSQRISFYAIFSPRTGQKVKIWEQRPKEGQILLLTNEHWDELDP